jgi:hypothetical protein
MQELLANRLNQLDGSNTGLDVMIVVVAIFLNAVQSIFVLILAVSNKARILRSPCGMRGPIIIKDAGAKRVTATTGLLAFAFGKKTVARSQRATVGQVDNTVFHMSLGLDGLVLGFLGAHETTEPIHKLGIGSDVPLGPLDKDVSVEKVGGVQVAKFQEIAEDLFVRNELLDAVEESDFFLARSHGNRRWEGLRERRNQGRGDIGHVNGRFAMVILGSLGGSAKLTLSSSA